MTANDPVRLCLLGTPSLDAPGQDAAAVLGQPKRLAVFGYLAIRREHVRRDELVALFWPGTDDARAALNQAIHFLRRALGKNAIKSRGQDEVRVGDHIWCDVEAFERALAERRLEEALSLYRGDLMHGLNGNVTPEFSHWLDGERSRLQRLAIEAANTRADQCYRTGLLAKAVEWQRVALEIRPIDEAVLRNYLALLDEVGDAATALAEYDAFRERLKDYDLEPARETVQIVDNIKKRRPETGPALPVRDPKDRPQTSDPFLPPVSPAPARHSIWQDALATYQGWPVWRRTTLMLGVLIIVLLSAILVRDPTSEPDPLASLYPVHRVAVLYLEPRGDTVRVSPVADAITEALIQNLSWIESLDIVSSSGVRPFRRSNPPIDTLQTRLGGVGTFVTGTVTAIGPSSTVSVEIQNYEGVVERSLRFSFDEDRQVESTEAITAGVIDALREIIGDAVKLNRLRLGTQNEDAFQAVSRATYERKLLDNYVTLGNVAASEVTVMAVDSMLVSASGHDPAWPEPFVLRGQFAETMAWLCFAVSGECDSEVWLDKAIAFADSALARDGTYARGLELRGRARFNRFIHGRSQDTTELVRAQHDLTEATRADPKLAGAWSTLSAVYISRGMYQQASAAGTTAVKNDAFLEDIAGMKVRLFQAEFHLKNDDGAREHCRELQRYQKGKWPAAVCQLALLAWADSDPDTARAWAIHEAAVRDMGPISSLMKPMLDMMVAAVYAAAGNARQARTLLEEASAAAKDNPEALPFAAAALARLGDNHEALKLLARYVGDSPAVRRHVINERYFESLRPLFPDTWVNLESATPPTASSR